MKPERPDWQHSLSEEANPRTFGPHHTESFKHMSFCTAINCIDGRVQIPVINHLTGRFGVLYVDMVTETGPVARLSGSPGSSASASIFKRVDISVRAHGSRALAIVAHHDCAANIIPDEQQQSQLRTCVRYLARRYPKMTLLGLWVDANWKVEEVSSAGESLSPDSDSYA